jgi:hypothetical protein
MTFRRTRCAHCRQHFEPERQSQIVHLECVEAYVEAQVDKRARVEAKAALMAAKVERAETKRRKEAVKTNGQRKAEAQAAINRWIVHVRDAGLPCISCGRQHDGMNHAGHYRSRGSAPHMALDPRNLAKQCAPCNLYLHGNLIGYRAGLIERHGVAFVEALEADQEPRHYSGDDYDRIKCEYRELFKQATKGKA